MWGLGSGVAGTRAPGGVLDWSTRLSTPHTAWLLPSTLRIGTSLEQS